MIDVVETSEKDCQVWDDYVNRSENASAFQLWGWKRVFEKTYGFNSAYLTARENGRVVGVLPLLFVKGPVLGNYITSMPGGMATENDGAARALFDYAVELVKTHNFRYLALRDSFQKYDFPELVTDEAHVAMVIDMQPDLEEITRNINRKTRQRINKARKAELEATTDNNIELIEDYYPIYMQAMRERGTPTQGFKFFKNSVVQFPDHLDLLAIHKDKNMLGGGYSFTFQNTLVCLWSGMAREYLPLNTSYMLIWETIVLADKLGVTCLDLGRSQMDSGAYVHKKQWGAKPVQLYQQYYLNTANEAPSSGNNRNEERMYQTFVKGWQRVPLWMTELVGPMLRKQVPFG